MNAGMKAAPGADAHEPGATLEQAVVPGQVVAPRQAGAPAEASESVSPLAALLASPAAGVRASSPAAVSSPPWPEQPFVALCTDTRHPTLHGRVKIRREAPGADAPELWVPSLHGLSVRVGDRLLVQSVDGHEEPIVIGVIDGFFPRPAPPLQPGPSIVLERDEALRVASPDGQALIEIVQDEAGPIVRLLGHATRVELPGKLSITAAELELKASRGAVRVEATDEVQLVGETIQLN